MSKGSICTAFVLTLVMSPVAGQATKQDFVRRARQAQSAIQETFPVRDRCALGVMFGEGGVVTFKYDPRVSLRLEDEILAIDGWSAKGRAAKDIVEQLEALPPDARVQVRVIRDRADVTEDVACSSIIDFRTHERKMVDAAARSDFRTCRDAGEAYQNRYRLNSFGHHVSSHCAWFAGSLSKENWPVVFYKQVVLQIEEARADPEALPGVRTLVLANKTYFFQVGQGALYQDLEDQLARAQSAGSARESMPSASIASSGTGFFVGPDGTIITSQHVIADAGTIRVTTADGRQYDARVVSSSAGTDLAVLRIDHPSTAYLSFAPPRSVQPGDRVFTVGFPVVGLLGAEAKFTEGSVSAVSGPGGEQLFLQISVPVQPGNSGGPLVNEHGGVVGVIAAGAAVLPFLRETGSLPQNVNWAVKADYASPLVDLPLAGLPLTRAEAIIAAKAALVFIQVRPRS